MNIKARKALISEKIKPAGWSVERIDLRSNIVRIRKDEKVTFVCLWRGMTEAMLDGQIALTMRTV